MADKKISALPQATTPLTGTEVLPIVKSGATNQVSVADLTTGRAVGVANLTSTVSTPVVAGATTGSAGTLNSGTGTVALTGANGRGIGALVNTNINANTTLPYGGSYELFGLLSVSNMGAGAGYTTYGLAGYAESDGSPIGVRADAKSTSASNPAYGVYVGSVTGATNNYGIYVADTAAVNYFGGKLSIATTTNRDTFTVSQGIAMLGGGGTSEKYSGYNIRTWASSYLGSGGTKTVCNISSPNGGYVGGGLVRITTSYQYRGGNPGNNYAQYIVTTNSTATANLVTSVGTYPTVTVSTVGSGSTATLNVIVNYNGDSHVQVVVEVFGIVNTWNI